MKELKCKNCADRFPGCHSKCEFYAAFQAECEAERKKRLRASEIIEYEKEKNVTLTRLKNRKAKK